MAPIQGALRRVLRHHEPFPAVLLDRHWDVLATNDAAAAMFAFLLAGTAPARHPQDVTAQELRLGSFFPVDDVTGEHRRRFTDEHRRR